MRGAIAIFIASAAGVGGCGEIESVILPVRPSQSEFPQIQSRLLESGCSANNGCHTVVVGNFQLTPEPKSRAQFEAEYLLTKAHVDLEAPERSKLLRVNLSGDPENTGHPVCFESPCSCAYQAVYEWIAGRTLPLEAECPDACEMDTCR